MQQKLEGVDTIAQHRKPGRPTTIIEPRKITMQLHGADVDYIDSVRGEMSQASVIREIVRLWAVAHKTAGSRHRT